jgi:hypothetical protein
LLALNFVGLELFVQFCGGEVNSFFPARCKEGGKEKVDGK